MWIFVHMSARSCRRSSFVYLFSACSWFFLFSWCVFLWTCEWGHHCGHSGIHVFTQHFVFSAAAVLPHTCSVGHWGCSAQPWPTYLFPRGRPLAWISFRIFDSGVCHEYVCLSQIHNWVHWWNMICLDLTSLCSGDDCFQREIAFFFSWVRAETADSQMRRGHSVFGLYQLFDWWIMDEAIDCLAQLCSTDPLWIQFKYDQKPPGKCCHSFFPPFFSGAYKPRGVGKSSQTAKTLFALLG